MTEKDWVNATDPMLMLNFLKEKASNRKLRLLSCAVVRQVWDLLKQERSRRGIEVSERFADGHASAEELLSGAIEARKVDDAAAKAVWPTERRDHSLWRAERAAGAAVEAVERAAAAGAAKVRLDTIVSAMETAANEQRKRQCDLLRDLFEPFAPTVLSPAVLAWNGGIIRALAEAAYEHRILPSGALDQARLAVLADALEEAGADEPILEHLRGLGQHWRGCHVLDAILGKE